MVNILLEGYNIDAPWLYEELKHYIKPCHRVAVVAFSFRDSRVRSASDWDLLYGREGGKFYGGIVGGFAAYGVAEDQISFLNYFTDTRESAKKKIENADIVYFLGGLPDRMMDRIREFALEDTLMAHGGIVMGYSAGAMIQLAEYHLSPDGDYPEFRYDKGLPYLKGFYLEVHYEERAAQEAAIRRVLSERGGTVYATFPMKGALLVENGRVKPLGQVKIYPKEEPV